MSQPAGVLQRIATAMTAVLHEARGDARIPADLLEKMKAAWQDGIAYAAAK